MKAATKKKNPNVILNAVILECGVNEGIIEIIFNRKIFRNKKLSGY